MSITSSRRWNLPVNVVFDARPAVCAGVLAKVTSENLGYGGLVIRNLGNHVYSIKSDGFASGTGDFSGAILMNDGTGWSGSDMLTLPGLKPRDSCELGLLGFRSL